ncbi:MAG: sulfatase-like hydrolase/transferase [Arachnia sp.]
MSETSPGPRPNFVVILTDDQGRWAMPHRMPELVMPHMEAFLEESLELDQMYCASPVCSPSRASMMTGRMPSGHGVHDWLIGGRHPDAHPDRYLEGQPTTPEVLGDAGYQCAMSGKWHVGHSQEPAPGFEFWFAHRYGGGPYYGAPIWRDGEPAEEPRYFTDAVTGSALDFLATRDRDRPFYLQVNFTAPHDPWIENHPQELVDLYADTDFPSVPREKPHPWVAPRTDDFAAAFADPHRHLAGYCASLTAVDSSLGRIRGLLAEQGVADDTVVVYLSDNGFSCGQHGIWGKGNGTYPLNFWDNSVRVPCVVHLPGGATGTSAALLSSVSLHRTLCDLAGVSVPEDRWGAGASFAHVLRGEDTDGEDFVVVASEYGGARMVTDGRHKLVERVDGPGELYDLQQDPDERDNRFDDSHLQDTQQRLSSELRRRFEQQTRPGVSGWERPVTGFGQIHPTSRGLEDVHAYAQTREGSDGVRPPRT